MVLPMDVYFCTSEHGRWAEWLASSPHAINPDDAPQRFISGREAWVLQTYLRLRARGHRVHLSRRFVPGAVCVAHRDDVRIAQRPFRSYVVAIRPDREPIGICERRVVQNPHMVQSPRDHFLPHWPQPGLLPRDPARGPHLRRLGYVGRKAYLPAAFLQPAFTLALQQRGVELVIRDDRWHDYSDLDAILAIRYVPPVWAATKPATKLTNAWLAGCPAIVSPEPAYLALRESELDFALAHTTDEVLSAVDTLQHWPGRYEAMVARGKALAANYTADAISERWEQFLGGPVAEDYARWQTARRRWLEPMRFGWRAVTQRLECRRFWRQFQDELATLGAAPVLVEESKGPG